jgi:hypothetical protein
MATHASKARVAGLMVAAGAAAAGGLTAQAQAADVLPDLRPEPVSRYAFDARTIPNRVLMRFSTAISNVGAGDLVITGARPAPTAPFMSASQQVTQDSGPPTSLPLPVRWTFVSHAGHGHWHVPDFAQHVLRRVSPRPTTVAGAKVGFCPRDDKAAPGSSLPPGTPPRYADNCGGPDDQSLVAGIRAGYNDLYEAENADQWVDVTRLRPGRYALRIVADPRGMLRESNEANNAAVTTFRLPLLTAPLSRQRSTGSDQAVGIGGPRVPTVAFVTASHPGVATVRVQRRGRTVDTFRQRVPAGVARVKWDGRLANGRLAPRGPYQLKVTLRAAGTNSPALWVRFSVRSTTGR